MKTEITFIVPGKPKAQKRHRTSKGKRYDPSAKDKRDFLMQCIGHKPPKPWAGPIMMSIIFAFHRPKKYIDKYGIPVANAPYWKSTKPDVDNMTKLVLDSMQETFFFDDAQICSISATKIYSMETYTMVTMALLENH